MMACIILTAVAVLAPPNEVQHEWVSVRVCEAGAFWPDIPYAGQLHTVCEKVASDYIVSLQVGGVLPGAREVITYKARCDNYF